jgi:hypothetical protein
MGRGSLGTVTACLQLQGSHATESFGGQTEARATRRPRQGDRPHFEGRIRGGPSPREGDPPDYGTLTEVVVSGVPPQTDVYQLAMVVPSVTSWGFFPRVAKEATRPCRLEAFWMSFRNCFS